MLWIPCADVLAVFYVVRSHVLKYMGGWRKKARIWFDRWPDEAYLLYLCANSYMENKKVIR